MCTQLFLVAIMVGSLSNSVIISDQSFQFMLVVQIHLSQLTFVDYIKFWVFKAFTDLKAIPSSWLFIVLINDVVIANSRKGNILNWYSFDNWAARFILELRWGHIIFN